MSDDKFVEEIDVIEQEDLIPNPPHINKAPKYILIALVLLLGIVSALAVVFTAEGNKVDEPDNTEISTVKYII